MLFSILSFSLSSPNRMRHKLLDAPVCNLSEDVKADVYTWPWIHQGGIAEWSPLADVAHFWVLRFTPSFQCLHLQRRFQNAFKSPSRMGWVGWSGPRAIPFKPQTMWSVGICPIHSPQGKPALSHLKLFSFKPSNLIYGNYLSYMHGYLLWCIFKNVISKLGLRKTKLTIFEWIFWNKLNQGAPASMHWYSQDFLVHLGPCTLSLPLTWETEVSEKVWEVWRFA